MAREHEHELPQRPRVLVFFDYACPFCYVDQHRFDALQREPGLEFDVFLVPFELRPGMPEDGIDLAEVEAGHSQRVDEYLRRTAEKEGFPFVQPPFVPSTHRALVLGEVARDQGDDLHRKVHAAIFSAYFADGLDIGSVDVLRQIATATGIELSALEDAWSDETYDERLHQFRHVALHLGLDATPAALICNELLIGSRPAGVLRDALTRCDAHLEAEREGAAGAADGHARADDADDPERRTAAAEAVES
ncbi:MAG TPA: DsbA family protein [Coriobacteriia bacterium]|nr:DsbA family protein [Coriobacteriia bacterium]